jgi:hypothetical protein
MEEIPSVYWMVLIGVVSFFFCLVLWYIALFFKESRDTVRETREILNSTRESLLKLGRIIDEVESTVSSVKSTVGEITMKILLPLKAISGVFESFKRHTESKESSEDPLDELLND